MNKKEQAVKLRAEGKTFKEIGAELGVTASRAHQLAGNKRKPWSVTLAKQMARRGASWREISKAVGRTHCYILERIGPLRDYRK